MGKTDDTTLPLFPTTLQIGYYDLQICMEGTDYDPASFSRDPATLKRRPLNLRGVDRLRPTLQITNDDPRICMEEPVYDPATSSYNPANRKLRPSSAWKQSSTTLRRARRKEAISGRRSGEQTLDRRRLSSNVWGAPCQNAVLGLAQPCHKTQVAIVYTILQTLVSFIHQERKKESISASSSCNAT